MCLKEAWILIVIMGKSLTELQNILLSIFVTLQNYPLSLAIHFLWVKTVANDIKEYLNRKSTKY